MSAIPSASYATTAFFISVWVPLPGIIPWYHFGIFFILALVQRIYFLAGGSITDGTLFWWWEFLAVLAGIFVGYIFKLATNGPKLLQEKHGWEASAIVKFPFTSFLYAICHLLYANYPLPGSPWGLLGTLLTTTLVIMLVWVWLYQDRYVTAGYSTRQIWGFFLLWIFSNIVLMSFLWIIYSGLAEIWVTYIACGGTVLFILLVIGITKCVQTRSKRASA